MSSEVHTAKEDPEGHRKREPQESLCPPALGEASRPVKGARCYLEFVRVSVEGLGFRGLGV